MNKTWNKSAHPRSSPLSRPAVVGVFKDTGAGSEARAHRQHSNRYTTPRPPRTDREEEEAQRSHSATKSRNQKVTTTKKNNRHYY